MVWRVGPVVLLEIRIIGPERGPVTYIDNFLDEFAAIQRGQSIAKDRDVIEVWKDTEYVYRRVTRVEVAARVSIT